MSPLQSLLVSSECWQTRPTPNSLEKALESARKQESVEEAQKKLHQQRRHSSDMVTLAQEIEPDQRERLHCQSTSMNHQLDSLTQQIKTLSEKLDKLEKEKKDK